MGFFSGWKLNKEVNGGEILTIVGMLGGIALSAALVLYNYDKRIDENKFINERQTEQISGLSDQIERNRTEQKADLDKLDSKLDDIKNILIQRQDR